MNRVDTSSLLKANNVPYTTEQFQSNGFWGTRYIFETGKAATKARKVLGQNEVKRYFKQWCIDFY
jgi:hypothetical protein